VVRLRVLDSTPTHAGVVAIRSNGDEVSYLVVSSSNGRHTVLPKGHIEPGEQPTRAAMRELLEETGVQGKLIEQLDTRQLDKPNECAIVQYFLVEARIQGSPAELRSVSWLPYEEARARLSFEDAREVLDQARAAWERRNA
jgi:8-oxo-dGTP pyrophosphatase MutT (NUDIX family)